jgi:hypothetical protein
MELRRALLLFAIVLGIAALVSAIAQPPERRSKTATEDTAAPPLPPPTTKPTASPQPPGGPIALRLGPKNKTVKVETGAAATLTVVVAEPGQVTLEGLGLTASAEPNTPARFDLLVATPDTYRVLLAPSAGGEPRAIGSIDAALKK